MLFMASMAVADDTTTETCANGAGIVITGNLSGHKYCLSNQNMSWWNAYAWCDSYSNNSFGDIPKNKQMGMVCYTYQKRFGIHSTHFYKPIEHRF